MWVAVDQLDAIVIVGVVAGRNHDAAIKIIRPGDVGNRRSGGDVQQIDICAGSGQTCNQTVLEHIGATAGVLADCNACCRCVHAERCNTSRGSGPSYRHGLRSE